MARLFSGVLCRLNSCSVRVEYSSNPDQSKDQVIILSLISIQNMRTDETSGGGGQPTDNLSQQRQALKYEKDQNY
jgi:hypothetical protein